MKKYLINLMITLSIFTAEVHSEQCEYQSEGESFNIEAQDTFGCLFETRSLKSFEENQVNISFKKINNELHFINNANKEAVFDKIEIGGPEGLLVRQVSFDIKRNLLFIQYGYNAFISEGPSSVGVDAAFYKVRVYFVSKNSIIKVSDKPVDEGIDGFYWGKYSHYINKSTKSFDIFSKNEKINFPNNLEKLKNE